MSDLTGMRFKLQLSEPLNPTVHSLSPGGFEINGKKFDFTTSRISKEHLLSSVIVEMEDFDKDYSEGKGIALSDIENHEFTEFYVYLGEKDDERVRIEKVSDLSFEFNNGVLVYNAPNDGLLVKSANDLIAEQIEEEFER